MPLFCSEWYCDFCEITCTLVGYIPYFPLVLLFNSPNVMLSSQWNIGWTMNCMDVLLGALLFCHIIRGWIESDKKWSAVENRWQSQMRDAALPEYKSENYLDEVSSGVVKSLWTTGLFLSLQLSLPTAQSPVAIWNELCGFHPSDWVHCFKVVLTPAVPVPSAIYGCWLHHRKKCQRMHRSASTSFPHGDIIACLKSPPWFCVATCIMCQWKGHVFSL